MTEPLLRELDKLSIWDLSHYWHGANPQLTTPSTLPVEVQQAMRALALKASKSLYLKCSPNGFIHKQLTDPNDQITISLVKRIYKREFQYAIQGKKYKRSFLSGISISRKGVLIWCKKNKIKPPEFWFAEDDPLLNKTIEELDTFLSPEQMQKYGFVPMFNTNHENEMLDSSYQFSSDFDNESNKPDLKKKNSFIEEAISEINKVNAKARYKELDEIKASFMKYYISNKASGKFKSELARQFYDGLIFAEKVLVVPTYNEADKKECYKKAVRNLLKVIK